MSNLSELDFLCSVYRFTKYETKNWRKILKLADDSLDLDEKRKLSWTWPSIEDVNKLEEVFKRLTIKIVLSIGCGSGLFEWILQESIGVKFFGLETDRCWWQRSHAVKRFIKHSYIEDLKPNCLPETFMQRCCNIHENKNWNFAIMFCYFNNRSAFLNYLKMYKGQWIIIVGPLPQLHIHTDPSPLEPNFPNEKTWILYEHLPIGDNDVLTIYGKDQCINKNENKNKKYS